jgi:hypothetical protein
MALRTTKTWWGVVLDAADGVALAHVYAQLLGWQVFTEGKGGAAVAPSEDAGYNLVFDIEVDDLNEAVAHALAVGAQQSAYQPQETVRVMLDPAGHPFCLYLDNA